MREKIQRFHNDVISLHNINLFETLVYPFNIITDSVKSFIFEDINQEDTEPLRGYIALKDYDGKKVKYFIEDKFYDKLPIRLNDCEELYFKESANRKSIILYCTNPTPFKIVPENCFSSTKAFVDEFADFEHTNPEGWTLAKICAIMGYVGKTFLGMCSSSEFGKSSIYEIIHGITQKSPVFQPRSIPGILIQITGDGNIVFDEVHQSSSEIKSCMENFTLQVAGNKPVYINGAMRAKNTKAKYDVSSQSITFLYNLQSYYKDEDDFFDNFFSNNSAIDARLLKIKLDGKLLEKFDRNFNLKQVAEDNKQYYMRIAKHLLYLKKLKLTNGYKRRYECNCTLKLKGRRKQIYDEITWLIDMYSKDMEEYVNFIGLFEKAIKDYNDMIEFDKPEVQEEFVR